MRARCLQVIGVVVTVVFILVAVGYHWGPARLTLGSVSTKWRPLTNAMSRNIHEIVMGGSRKSQNSAVADDVKTRVVDREGVSQPGAAGVNVVEIKYPPDASLLNKNADKDHAMYWSAKNQLRRGLIPTNVHFIWCREHRWFEFKHYLGVVSAIRTLQPDKIIFHMQYPPVLDKLYYNLWLDDLKHDHTFFKTEKMDPEKAGRYCNGDINNRMQVIRQLLKEDGGIFVSEKTWLLKIEPLDRDIDFVMGLDTSDYEGYVMLRRNIWPSGKTHNELMSNKSVRSKTSSCAQVHHLYTGGDLAKNADCLVISGPRHNTFWPMHIWNLDDPFGRLARRVFYGTEEIRQLQPSYDELVPNIAHMVWIGGRRMDLVFYLSVLSLLYVAEVDTVYIHGDREPGGGFWPNVTSNPRIRDRVVFVNRDAPVSVFGGEIEPWYRALMSDIIRVDLMIKYGGIYTDTDAIWVRKLSPEDRGYDAVATFDWVDWSYPYPDSVNFGISYGKKNAPFWQIFRDSMRQLHNDHHGFTGVMMPYKLLERYPHLLRIDTHLAVICYYSKCHPIYAPDYHNMSKDHTNMGYLKDWKNDVNAFHWTHPNPAVYANMSALREGQGLFADIGRFVLEKAGLW